jgi:hypothetical protein
MRGLTLIIFNITLKVHYKDANKSPSGFPPFSLLAARRDFLVLLNLSLP